TVKTVSVIEGDRKVTGANGITVEADLDITDLHTGVQAEWLIAPGGMPGSTNLAQSLKLSEMLSAHHAAGGKIAAICAAPAVVLAPLGILDGRKATCYPGFEDACMGADMQDARVVVDGNVITANGPSSAFPFALAIVRMSMGDAVADAVGTGTLYYPEYK
ncbi:MAG: DJ-1/PfpI family protein, partial [Muribaculaceae bacterium]|nr:DJ-1/PfpI family protein [Muribaculaceae bacterium]